MGCVLMLTTCITFVASMAIMLYRYVAVLTRSVRITCTSNGGSLARRASRWCLWSDMHCLQDGVVNAYLAKVFDNLPRHMARAVHLFSTFFFTKLLGPKPPVIHSTPKQLLNAIKYMDVRRCDISNWAFMGRSNESCSFASFWYLDEPWCD